MLDLKCS